MPVPVLSPPGSERSYKGELLDLKVAVGASNVKYKKVRGSNGTCKHWRIWSERDSHERPWLLTVGPLTACKAILERTYIRRTLRAMRKLSDGSESRRLYSASSQIDELVAMGTLTTAARLKLILKVQKQWTWTRAMR